MTSPDPQTDRQLIFIYIDRLYVFDNNGEYGTTHWLSNSMVVPLRFFIIAVLPPSSVDLLLYCG